MIGVGLYASNSDMTDCSNCNFIAGNGCVIDVGLNGSGPDVTVRSTCHPVTGDGELIRPVFLSSVGIRPSCGAKLLWL